MLFEIREETLHREKLELVNKFKHLGIDVKGEVSVMAEAITCSERMVQSRRVIKENKLSFKVAVGLTPACNLAPPGPLSYSNLLPRATKFRWDLYLP